MTNNYGSIPSQTIREFIAQGVIAGKESIPEKSIQPASLDLSLSKRGWRLQGSIMPRREEKVADLIKPFMLYELDLSQPVIIEKGAIYLFELNEGLSLPDDIYAATEGKSSTGRVDLQTRLLVDGQPRFDTVPAGYKGPLYVEVTSRSFIIQLQQGLTLNQLRLFKGSEALGDRELKSLHDEEGILFDKNGKQIEFDHVYVDKGGLMMSVDLNQDIIGYRARNTNRILSMLSSGQLDGGDFFEEIPRPADGNLILRQADFYILSSLEFIRVPPAYAVQMLPYDTASGEFRSHYAGFFDPGFGYGDKGDIKGTPAVLEVRAHGDDFILRDGQPICKMMYSPVTEMPDMVYGVGELGSHYLDQRGPRLSKYFK